MTTVYKLQKDVVGFNGFGLPFTDQRVSSTLSATSDTSTTVPSNGAIGAPLNSVNRFLAIVEVTYGLNVYCALNTAAAAPVGDTFAASVSDLIVGGEYYAREVKAGDVLHFYAPEADTSVVILYYALPAS